MNLLPNSQTCAICLEELLIPSINSCITECAHVFHLTCILKNREHNTRCPICRKDIQPEQEQMVNISPEPIIDSNYPYEDVYLNRNEIFIEISNGMRLDSDIRDIVSCVGDMENNQFEPIISHIQDVCIEFANSSLQYFRNVLQYDINYLNYDINIAMNIHLNRYYNKIVDIIHSAINNNIQNNITLDHMENDIRNLCFDYTERVIFNISS